MTTRTVTQAKNSLLELLRGVEERGETVQITRNGVPAGVLVSAEEWESLLETLSILSDAAAMKKKTRARRELAAGALLTHQQVWRMDGVPAALVLQQPVELPAHALHLDFVVGLFPEDPAF